MLMICPHGRTHFGRDAEIQAMDGIQSVVQVLDSGDLPSLSFPSWIQGDLLYPTVCHPWTLDFGIPAEMTGLQHLCITMRAPAWEPLSCKLLLGRSSKSRRFKNLILKRELGNEQIRET